MDDLKSQADNKREGNKIAVFFVLKMFILYFLLAGFNKFIYSATTPTGRFYNAFVSSHFDYIQGLRNALIIPSTWIIKAFGCITYHNATEIMVIDGPILSINYDCLGLNVMSFLIAFVTAFPAPWKPKARLLGISILTVYLLNVIRISGLALLLKFFPSQQVNFQYHHEAFSITVYIVIFIMLYLWIKKNARLPKAQHSA
ncbi:MAG: archaeosortase/exosortase family protein [Mucilaginibacter sp.]|nr:archaeosortase/exosortase family protein [Mucilaginibacter sp.]